MRIFLIWDDKNSEITNSVLRLNEQPNKIVYWIGGQEINKNKFPETIFHNDLDALRGIPAQGVDTSEFTPPGKELIDKLHKVESLILTMMNMKLDELCTDKRKHLYYNMLQYWCGVFKKYKLEVIIFGNIPHDTCSYLIYELAHLLNIKTIIIEDTVVSDRLLTYNDFWAGNKDLQDELHNNQNRKFFLGDLSNDIQNYYRLQIDPSRNVAPVYIKIQKNRHSGFNLFLRKLKRLKNSIKEGTILKFLAQYIGKQFKTNLKKEYHDIQINPDFNKKFVYVPLHVQPERSTSPQGDIFVDQILMLEILSASLPSDWIVYVKEHPSQWPRRRLSFSSARYQGYYKKLVQIKNVYLVPIETDNYALINKSQTVATVAGTAAWEAILKSKPAIIFGYPWYRDCPVLFRVDDTGSCRNALQKIANGLTIDQQKILNYLKCLDNVSFHGCISPDLEQNSTITKKESRNNIIEKIISEIKKLTINNN